jgi:hypothetical protein
MADEVLRQALHEMAHRQMLPLVARTSGSEGEEGFRCATSRAEVRSYSASLFGRADRAQEMADAIAAGAEPWLDTPPHERQVTTQRYDQDLVAAILRDLSRKAPTTAAVLAERHLDAANYEDATAMTSRVRAVVREMRLTGCPIVASATGYRVARDLSEVETYLRRLGRRIAALRDHARSVERAGALWWPETATEHADRARDESAKGGVAPLAPSVSARQREEARERHNAQAREQAHRERVAEIEASRPAVEARMAHLEPLHRHASCYGRTRVSSRHRRAYDEYRACSAWLCDGTRPAAKAARDYAWLPPARKGRAQAKGTS